MKILLINPPSFNEIVGNNPEIIDSERGYNPPLGILYIAAYLKKHSAHNVRVLDAQVEEINYNVLEDRIAGMNPDIVGITAMSFTMIDVIETLKTVKKVKGSIRTVLGGPHVFIYPDETINLPGVDFLILGEGEISFNRLVNTLETGSDLSQVPGLVYKDENNKIIKIDVAPLIDNLDELPHPAREITPYKKYSSILFSRMPVTTMFTSRGCPYRCSFCLRPHLGNRFRARSPENIIAEIDECIALGIKDFLIYDDTFTVIRKRVLEICELIINKKLDIRWDCRARIDTVDEEMLKRMKKAGCGGIHYGIEAGSPKIMENLKKDIDLKKAKIVCDMTHRLGIRTLNYFMIGSPGETVEDIEETFKIMKWLKADFIHMTIFTPFPGTPIYNSGLENGIIKKDYWREFAINPVRGFVPPHWPEYFKLDELQKILVKGYKKFYLSPVFVVKSLLKIRTFGELYRKAKAGFKVFIMKNRK